MACCAHVANRTTRNAREKNNVEHQHCRNAGRSPHHPPPLSVDRTRRHVQGGYLSQANGAHFLVGKEGHIYQTASVSKQCYHVGRLIKSKCLTVSAANCKTPQMAKALASSGVAQFRAIDAVERSKNYPNRYPVNSDSIGIEMVGRHIDDSTYESLTVRQNASLQWLVGELYIHLGLGAADVYRHPEVSYKNAGEAKSATWK